MKKYIIAGAVSLIIASVKLVRADDCYTDDDTVLCGGINTSGPDVHLDCDGDGVKETTKHSKWKDNTYYTKARNANAGESGVTSTVGKSYCSGKIIYLDCNNTVVTVDYTGPNPYSATVKQPPTPCTGA